MAKFTEAFQSYLREVAEALEDVKSGEIDEIKDFSRRRLAAMMKYIDEMTQVEVEALCEATAQQLHETQNTIYEVNKELARRGLPTRPIPGQDPEKPN